MWAIWAMRENRAVFPSPKLVLMDRSAGRAVKKKIKKVHAI